jgi:hypothetical protein
MLPVD